jgi:hypothetical protein
MLNNTTHYVKVYHIGRKFIVNVCGRGHSEDTIIFTHSIYGTQTEANRVAAKLATVHNIPLEVV